MEEFVETDVGVGAAYDVVELFDKARLSEKQRKEQEQQSVDHDDRNCCTEGSTLVIRVVDLNAKFL